MEKCLARRSALDHEVRDAAKVYQRSLAPARRCAPYAAWTGHLGARRAGFQIDLRGDDMVTAAHAQPDGGRSALLLCDVHTVGARRVAAEFAAHHLHVAVDIVLGGAGIADLLSLE